MDGFKKHLANIGVDVNSIPAPPEGIAFNEWVWQLASEGKIYSEKLGKLELPPQKKEFDKELLAEMPSTFEMAKNLWHHFRQVHKHYKATGRIYCDDDEIARRVAICKKCPSKKNIIDKKGSLRCVICGCHIEEVFGVNDLGKAEYDALHCERGHW